MNIIEPFLPKIAELMISIADQEPEDIERVFDQLFISLPPELAADIIISLHSQNKALACSYIITYMTCNARKHKSEDKEKWIKEYKNMCSQFEEKLIVFFTNEPSKIELINEKKDFIISAIASNKNNE